ncbi:ParM/StbA family protein [Acidithiobacillus sp. MC6.1]|nr:ParM/StbA family protein [Acidithiobacillus sp. MC6.1]
MSANKTSCAGINCAGINIGYGHLKLATPSGLLVTASAVAPSNPLYDGIGRARDTHKTVFKGEEFEVGAEAILLTRTPETARLPVPQWSATLRYQVLAQLVKDRLRAESPDWHVVIGVPISDYRDAAYRKSLKHFWTGKHETTSGLLTIEDARVVPEPIGAIFAYMQGFSEQEIQEESARSHLVIDVGFFTSDWLALSRLSPDLEQSRGIDIGMHAILTQMSEQIAADYQKSGVSDLVTLENLLLEQIATGKSGKVDLLQYAIQATAKIAPPLMDDIKASTYRWLRSDDAKKILLAGGAASFLLPHVQESFPGIEVEVVRDPQTANAVGYRLQCEMLHG